jgi:cytidine deaminase
LSESTKNSTKPTPEEILQILDKLSPYAWQVRENAIVLGKTRVGCAVISGNGKIFSGCNIEHRFRCHDVHAEINALTTMVAGGEKTAKVVLIAAERSRFTPCGGCLDWIMELGGKDTVVAFQNSPTNEFQIFKASELMPNYPE